MTDFRVVSYAKYTRDDGTVWHKFALTTFEWKPAMEMTYEIADADPNEKARLEILTEAFESNEPIEFEMPYKGEDLL
jgi:hypothetical protein